MKRNLREFVKERRRILKFTQNDLAEKAGVGLRFIRELEQGKQTLRLDKVDQVLSLFGYRMGPVKAGYENE
ncbi:MAG: helix-turn-helix transcriptional regulator [Candidatus Cloacimonetes bacterium]|nr:helix-turn-helix transcriptional regulator [Candidatus Cloacimonadota bacterium]MBL7148959.1 helix-turn-helix transcriptional regulator [Candidatus Cloacimonadota bacterium]